MQAGKQNEKQEGHSEEELALRVCIWREGRAATRMGLLNRPSVPQQQRPGDTGISAQSALASCTKPSALDMHLTEFCFWKSKEPKQSQDWRDVSYREKARAQHRIVVVFFS